MIRLYAHQLRAVEISRTQLRYGFGWECGTGKTLALLGIIADAKSRGWEGQTVVVAPKSVLWSAWLRDAEHFPSLKPVVCWGTTASKRRKLIDTPDADVLIMNFEAFKSHAEELLASGRVTRLVVDEASKLRNRNSQISKCIFHFSQNVPSVYLLSGTPAPNGAWEYFGLLRCIDLQVFGVNWWRFVNGYFCAVKKLIGGREIVTDYRFLNGAEPRFLERLKSAWWTLRAEDCLDLPAETDEVREVILSPQEQQCYINLIQDLAHEWDDGDVTQVRIETRSMKLRQVTGGTLYDENHRTRIVGRSKLDDLLELLTEIGDRQLVVWCEFTSEIDRVTEELAEKGYNVSRIDGRTKGPERDRIINDFQAGRYQVVVCHPAACGHGVTLTAARFNYFCSLGWMPENHDQARKRIHRIGQHWPVVHYYAVARGTVDEKVLRVLKRKATASEAIKEVLSEAGRVEVMA